MNSWALSNRKVQLAFWSAIAILLVMGAISYRAMVSSDESDRWVRHSYTVIDNLQDLLAAMQAVESNCRGFVLTGNESFLESYRAGIVRTQKDQAAVRKLTVDNPEQQLRLTALERLTAEKIQFTEKLNSLRRSKGLAAAADAIRSGPGKQIMDDIQGVIRELRDEELQLLPLREADAKRRVGQSKTVLVIGTILGVLIAAAATWSVQRDGAGRGLAEEALRGSEEKYRMLLDGVQDYAIFMLDPRGRVVSWNAGAQRIKGYTAEQIIGRNFSCFFPSEDIEQGRPEAVLRMAAANGRHEEQSMRVRKGGTRFLASVTFTALRDPAGKLRGFSEVSRDLSKSTESEARYRGLLEAAPDAMVVVNQDGEIVLLNVQAEKQFGYRRDELLGQKVKNLIPEGFAERLLADGLRSAADALAQQIGTGIELTGRRKDGSEFPIEILLSPLESAEGILVTAAIRDITARKKAERSLQERVQITALGADVGTAMTRGKTLEETLQLYCEAIVRHLHAAFARIWMINDAEDILELRASAGMYVHLDGPHARVPVGKFKIGLIAQERKPHLTNQVVGDPRVGDQEWAKREGMIAFAGYPLLVDDHLVGVVAMFARTPLADVTLQGLGSVSNTIALGIDRKLSEEALRQSELRFRRVAEQSPDPVIIHQDGTIVFTNDALVRLLRATTSADLVGRSVISMVHPEVRHDVEERIRQLYAGQNLPLSEQTYVRLDGSVVEVEVSSSPFMLEEKPAAIVTIRDITKRKEQERRIVRLSRIHAMLSGINSAIVRIRDRQELLNEACRIAAMHGAFRVAWFGLRNQATEEMNLVASAGFDPGFFEKLMHAAPKGAFGPHGVGTRAFQERRTFIDNDILANPDINVVRRQAVNRGCRSVIGLPLSSEGVTVGSLILYADDKDFFDEEEVKLLEEVAGDISFGLEFIAKEERAHYLAYYDALTGLANRSLFLERMTQYMRSAVSGGHKLALYLIDLERFKNINDSLGQPAGDALLRQVAEWLTRNLGDANLLARFDADHFGVVLPKVEREGDVARLLEKTMVAFLNRPFHLNDSILRIAAKVGVALFPDDGADADTLFKNAEAALKKAKASGDRYLFYTQKMTETVAAKLTLETQLRHALDKGEFVLHYQPKVNLASGKLTGAEGLIRWNDPRTGLVPPGRFIPILEETGLIHEVGRWALRRAIEDYLRWRTAGLAAVRLAVNVSPLQLRNRTFIAEIEQAIGIDAHAAAGLELEITESLIMEDVKHNIASLQAIRVMGVTIAIDDFGTGFSSLSYLAKLPVDTLKIDRSFVTDMTAGQEGLALVSTIINLAHSLKLKVVAEGVETEEQSRLLRLMDCDEMQGFLFSKPVPSEIFETRFLAPPSVALNAA